MAVESTITTYEAYTRENTGFFASVLVMLRNIYGSRELIWQLFKRDFLASNKKSFLGLGWIVLSPIIGILSWVFMNAAGVLRPGDVGIPYPAYVLLGTTFWGLFLGLFNGALQTLSAGQGFIAQVKYHHEAILAKQIMEQLANFAIVFALVLAALMIFGVYPSWQTLLLPLLILPMLFLACAFGLVLSPFNLMTVEVRKITDIAFGFLLLLTPIVYSAKVSNGVLGVIVKYNPLTYAVGNVRDVVAYGRLDHPAYFLATALGSFLLFVLSWRLFFLAEEKVVEKMG